MNAVLRKRSQSRSSRVMTVDSPVGIGSLMTTAPKSSVGYQAKPQPENWGSFSMPSSPDSLMVGDEALSLSLGLSGAGATWRF